MTIRKADFEDLSSILTLVHELAKYEKAPQEVWATIQDYEKAFKEGVFEAFVAEEAGHIVGTTVYYMSWSTWKGKMLFLEDFVVMEAHRQGGIGQQLFDATLSRAVELDCTLMKWQVLDWNEPALKFYQKNNAVIEKGWWNGKILLKKAP